MSTSCVSGTLPTMRATTWRASASLLIGLWLAACGASPAPSAGGTPGASPSTASAQPTAEQTASPQASPPAAGWQPVEMAGDVPAAREDHTMTVTPDGSTAYLFGGRTTDGEALGDLWALDLATDAWSRVPGNGPPPRFGHNAAWVDGVGLVIFAGQSPAAFFNDLWAYDPAADAWSELQSGGDPPVARYGSCAAVGPDGRLWISHGFTSEGSRFADTRAYDFDVASWTDETPAAERPIKRCLHGCWWTDDGRLALYAGQTDGVPSLGDLWQLTPGPRPGTNAWSEVEPSNRWPEARQLYAYVRWGHATLVFGGGALNGDYLADAWLVDDAGGVERVRADRLPPARAGAELVADPVRRRVLMFGGRDADAAMDDLWQLELPLPG